MLDYLNVLHCTESVKRDDIENFFIDRSDQINITYEHSLHSMIQS